MTDLPTRATRLQAIAGLPSYALISISEAAAIHGVSDATEQALAASDPDYPARIWTSRRTRRIKLGEYIAYLESKAVAA